MTCGRHNIKCVCMIAAWDNDGIGYNPAACTRWRTCVFASAQCYCCRGPNSLPFRSPRVSSSPRRHCRFGARGHWPGSSGHMGAFEPAKDPAPVPPTRDPILHMARPGPARPRPRGGEGEYSIFEIMKIALGHNYWRWKFWKNSHFVLGISRQNEKIIFFIKENLHTIRLFYGKNNNRQLYIYFPHLVILVS